MRSFGSVSEALQIDAVEWQCSLTYRSKAGSALECNGVAIVLSSRQKSEVDSWCNGRKWMRGSFLAEGKAALICAPLAALKVK